MTAFQAVMCPCCYCSVAKSCPTLCDSMGYSTPASLSSTVSHSLLKLMSTESMMPSNHLILGCPLLLLLPSIFPRIRVFSSESALHIRWSKYWSFSFSINTSSEYSRLISFRIDLFDLFAVQGALKSFFPSTTIWKHQFFGTQLSLVVSPYVLHIV